MPCTVLNYLHLLYGLIQSSEYSCEVGGGILLLHWREQVLRGHLMEIPPIVNSVVLQLAPLSSNWHWSLAVLGVTTAFFPVKCILLYCFIPSSLPILLDLLL